MSVKVTWDERFATGDETVDRQHQHLFALVNAVHEAATEGRGEDVKYAMIAEFNRYADAHFAAEEALMERIGYENLDAHRLEHEALTARVRELTANAEDVHALDLCLFAYDWLMHHILEWDVPMIGHAQETGQSIEAF